MSTLLQSTELSIISQTTRDNPKNGSEAESFAAAKILLALRSEVKWGTREEDGRKIDLVFSFEHPWIEKERVIVLCQVKSGSTYGQTLQKGFQLETKAFKIIKRKASSIFTIWVDRDKHKSFWAYIHPKSKVEATEYGRHHTISPATLFDLVRCVSRENISVQVGGKGLKIKKNTSPLNIKRKEVLKEYRSFNTICSPVLGNIHITRLGWRHMFRKSRIRNYKASSLDCIPYLKAILEQKPNQHIITEVKEWKNKGYVYRQMEHLLKYNHIRLYNNDKRIGICRIIEEIRYPENWMEISILNQIVNRRLTLKTIYHKSRP